MKHMPKAGSLVSGIAVIHLGVGLLLAQPPLRAILADGVVGAVDPHIDRMAIFWFMFFGLLLLLLGEVLRAWESVATPPARIGYGLGALSLAGGLLIPASGFWLALLPAVLLIHRSREAS
jgi:hypothetical protein